MYSQAELVQMAETALAASTADETEVLITSGESALTRYANNQIHQNVADHSAGIALRVVCGKRLGSARTTRVDADALRALAPEAVAMAKWQPEVPDFPGLPEPAPISEVEAWSAKTAAFGPEDRAEGVRTVLAVAERDHLTAAGAWANSSGELLVANSRGVRAFRQATDAGLNLVMTGDDSSGWAGAVAPGVDEIDLPALARRAAEKARRSARPRDLEPGEYAVVLEPEAVRTLVEFLGLAGLGALSYQENRSFMCGKIGRKICGDNITIWDDGLDQRGMPTPFDYEGVPKQRVELITRGVAQGLVYDSQTAAKEGKQSTGHALPAPNTWGPIPTNLFLAPGDATLDEMIASTDRGLLVTRFHYTNLANPMQTTITGMTRDGTFLIENGRVVGGVKNLRFTQSILEALSCVEAIGSELVRGDWATVPALKIAKFRFSGATQF